MMSDFVQAIFFLLAFATLIQFCVDRVKEIAGEKVMAIIKPPVWAAALGIVFSLVFSLDIFAIFGFSAALPYIAQVATGLMLSAGAVPLHELFAKLRQSRTDAEALLDISSLVAGDSNSQLDRRNKSKIYTKSDSIDV